MADSEWLWPLLKQSWVVSAVLAVLFGQGMSLGFSSALIASLQTPESSIQINVETSSWILTSLAIACVLSLAVASSLISAYGRRNTMMLCLTPGIVGSLVCFFATNISGLLIGRFLQGLTVGCTGVLGAIIIGEYTSPKYRGVFLNLKNAVYFVGITFVHVLGHFLHWRTVSLINAIPFSLALVMTYTWPQSPYWLAGKRDFQRCTESFYYMRGISTQATMELEEILEAQKRKSIEHKKTCCDHILTFLRKFKRRDFVRPLFIYVFAAMLMETTGRHVFPSYALQFIINITGDKSNSFYYNLYIDLIITTSAFISSILVRGMKRRTLLFSTGTAACAILLVICVYLFLQSKDIISKDHILVPLISFAFYFVLVNLGCSPITLALVGELFPLEHRPTAACIAGIFVSIFFTITLKLTPMMLYKLNAYGTFAVFGVCMVISLTSLYFLLPETKDKTLQEIENYFNYGKYRDDVFESEENINLNMIVEDDDINATQ